jgi:hypothetical protein
VSPKVKVVNPSGGPSCTSRKQAVRYVSRGLARWVGPAIEFIRDGGDYRESAFSLSVANSQHVHTVGFATLDALRKTPIVCAAKAFLGKSVVVAPVNYPNSEFLVARPLPIENVPLIVQHWDGIPLNSPEYLFINKRVSA